MAIYDSLHSIPLDKLSEVAGGRNRLTYLVSKRLRAVNEGAQLLVEPFEGEATLAAVCREVLEGKIWLEIPSVEDVPEDDQDYNILDLAEDVGADIEV